MKSVFVRIARVGLGMTTLALLAFPVRVANAQTNWESAIRKNTPSHIELTSIQEGETKLVIRGKANSNPDLGMYMRTLSETVGEPSLDQTRREDNKSVFVLTVKKTKHEGNRR